MEITTNKLPLIIEIITTISPFKIEILLSKAHYTKSPKTHIDQNHPAKGGTVHRYCWKINRICNSVESLSDMKYYFK
jgi:hypothetical protein